MAHRHSYDAPWLSFLRGHCETCTCHQSGWEGMPMHAQDVYSTRRVERGWDAGFSAPGVREDMRGAEGRIGGDVGDAKATRYSTPYEPRRRYVDSDEASRHHHHVIFPSRHHGHAARTCLHPPLPYPVDTRPRTCHPPLPYPVHTRTPSPPCPYHDSSIVYQASPSPCLPHTSSSSSPSSHTDALQTHQHGTDAISQDPSPQARRPRGALHGYQIARRPLPVGARVMQGLVVHTVPAAPAQQRGDGRRRDEFKDKAKREYDILKETYEQGPVGWGF